MPPDAPQPRQIRRGRAVQFGLDWDCSEFAIDLPIADLPPSLDGFRILHLSDTHFHPTWRPSYDVALERIAAMNADLIAFTGDWVEDKFDPRPGLPTSVRFARGLRSKFGTFSCLGNHDGDLLAPLLMNAGVRVLVGESAHLVGGDGAIEIVGLPGVYRSDLVDAFLSDFAPPPPNVFRLVLGHYPDQVLRVAPTLAPQLMLAGHTHGGQICLPGGVPIIRHDSLPRRQITGLHRFDRTWLHTSRGLGCSQWNVRLCCPPEMTVITLRRGAAR